MNPLTIAWALERRALLAETRKPTLTILSRKTGQLIGTYSALYPSDIPRSERIALSAALGDAREQERDRWRRGEISDEEFDEPAIGDLVVGRVHPVVAGALRSIQVLSPCKTQTSSASQSVDGCPLHAEADGTRKRRQAALETGQVPDSRTGGAHPPTGAK